LKAGASQGHLKEASMLIWGFIARHFRRWQVYHRTVAELSHLDDRSLTDIAVARNDIHRIALAAAQAA